MDRTEYAKTILAESRKTVDRSRGEYKERTTGHPIPSARECDLIKLGAPILHKETASDIPAEPHPRREAPRQDVPQEAPRQMETRQMEAGTKGEYTTRASRASTSSSSSSSSSSTQSTPDQKT